MKLIPLITRPKHKGALLAEKITAVGGVSYCCPFVDIAIGEEFNQIPSLLTALSSKDYVIAISDNAVQYTQTSLKQNNLYWPANINYIAVGPTTAHCWQQYGVKSPLVPLTYDSEGILALLENTDLTTSKIIILRGNGGRETLADELSKRCLNVTHCEVYQRVTPSYEGIELANKWQQLAINSVIITSGEILRNLMRSIPENALAWITNLYFIVPSQRVANLAYQLGINHVTIAQGASNEALFNALEKLDMQIGIS